MPVCDEDDMKDHIAGLGKPMQLPKIKKALSQRPFLHVGPAGSGKKFLLNEPLEGRKRSFFDLGVISIQDGTK